MADHHEDETLSGDETEREDSHTQRARGGDFDSTTVIIPLSLNKKDRPSPSEGFYTDNFTCGEYTWRLYYFPMGNNKSRCFSVYIEAVPPESNKEDYRVTAQFRLTAVNHLGKNSHTHKATHNFQINAKDWGFTEFVRQEDLYDPAVGFLKDGCLHILVETAVQDSLVSRQDTGYIGIMNQGATCYMNSILQALFHLPYFRRVVYRMPLAEGKGVTIPYALQALFYRLQTSSTPASTKQLTKSFGWEDDDSFSQHDVTEFNRVLIDTLEMEMKGTPVEGTMEKLFRGEFVNYIECINVTYKSERPEYFYDLQMPIEGCKTIYDSFRKYVLPETLNGENKYHAEGHGLQDANRGIRFKTFPDILELNLNRFKQDFFMDRIQKINDRFEFYPVIDLKEFADPNEKESTVYHLHGVLVHSGTMQGGHYNVFLRPTEGPEWYRFDDSSVRKSKERVAVDDNFGEDEDYRTANVYHRKFSSAYMLIYVRDSRVKDIFKTVEDSDIPQFLIERLEREQAEIKRRAQEKEEAEKYVDVAIVTQEMLYKDEQESFDMIDLAKVPKLKVRKDMTLRQFREGWAKENGVDNPEKIRLWEWISRKNQTQRVEYPVETYDRELGRMDLYSKTGSPFIRLFLELSQEENEPFFRPIEPRTKSTAIIFFKYFDLANQRLRHVGHALFQKSDRVSDFVPVAKKMAGIPEEEGVRLYEEVKPLRIDSLDEKKTLKQAELITGDVIIVEDDFPEEERKRFDNPHVSQFFSNIVNRVEIHFRKMDSPEENVFTLVLNKTMEYMEVAKRVGERIGVPGDRVRLFSQSKANRLASIKTKATLEIMTKSSQPSFTLYFLEMDMTIEEYSKLQHRVVQFWQGARRYSSEELLMPQEATFEDLVVALKKQVNLKGSKEIRMYISKDGYLEDYAPMKTELSRVGHSYSIVAEEVAEEEVELGEGDRLMKVMHYASNYHGYQFHGVPFFVVVKKGDSLGDVKERIRKRLKVKKEGFNVWKLAMISEKRVPSLVSGSVEEDTPFDKIATNGIIGIGLQHQKEEKSYGWKEKGIAFKT